MSRIAGAVLAGLMVVAANGATGAEKAAPADFTVAVSGKGQGQMPGWEFVDAAVEYEHAAACSFRAGRIAHVGSIGLCLRRGTADIVVEGNEVYDTGGNGIAAGYMENAAYGYLHAPGPAPDEATGYRIANNYVHHCGVTDCAGCGVILGESKSWNKGRRPRKFWKPSRRRRGLSRLTGGSASRRLLQRM